MEDTVICPRCKNTMSPAFDPNGESTGDWYCQNDGSVSLIGYGIEEE